MNSLARRNLIVELVAQAGTLSVLELMDRIKASPATIRRDLSDLAESGLIIRTHGYVHSVDADAIVLPSKKRVSISPSEKMHIGQYAASLVHDGMTLILDSGTTTLEIARALKDKYLTVVTNSVEICQELAQDSSCKVICCGGMLEKEHLCFLGRDALNFISSIEVDLAFIGATGVREGSGLTTSSPLQFDYKRNLLSVAKTKIAVFDLAKFKSANLYVFAHFNELSAIVTNTPAPQSPEEAIIKNLEQTGLKIYFADNE